jgi:predicted nuclease of predicted toxin-antitoxin system
MKGLIDECAPRALKHALAPHGHDCLTVQEAGWAGKVNGELLQLAEAEFDVLVTVDTNLEVSAKLGRTENRHRNSPRKIKSPDSP